MDLHGLNKAANKLFAANSLLLFFLSFTIFGVTLLPETWYEVTYILLISIILICIVFCLEKRYHLFSRITIVIIIVVLNIGFFSKIGFFNEISDTLIGLFLVFTVLRLLAQVARSKEVTINIIIQSISGFLLLGFVFSLAIARIDVHQPGSFSFPVNETGTIFNNFYDQLYYGFITMGTVGYGDIVPKTPFAKTFSILVGISGQLYVAIIIAMLVGKFSSTAQSNQQNV
jgi:voltage-gated potassium channel